MTRASPSGCENNPVLQFVGGLLLLWPFKVACALVVDDTWRTNPRLICCKSDSVNSPSGGPLLRP